MTPIESGLLAKKDDFALLLARVGVAPSDEVTVDVMLVVGSLFDIVGVGVNEDVKLVLGASEVSLELLVGVDEAAEVVADDDSVLDDDDVNGLDVSLKEHVCKCYRKEI